MNNILMKMILFNILINLAVGIMITAVPAFDGLDSRLGLNSQDDLNESFYDNEELDVWGKEINANPVAEDLTDVNSDTLMDRTVLGMMINILVIVNKYMFGFVLILQNLFSGVPIIIFNGIKSLIIILYALTGWELVSGKKIIGV